MAKIILSESEAAAADAPPPGRIVLTGFADPAPSRAPVPAPVADPPAGEDAPAQSLFINPDRFRQVPPELRDYNCTSCDRRAAGWAFLPSNEGPDPMPKPICSLCWLYLSHWGRARVAEVPQFVAAFAAHHGRTFTQDGDGRLTDHRQADDVVLQILKASVVFLRMQKLRGRAGER